MQWVIQANIKKFKSLLKAETDPTKRAFIARLLEEEAKQRAKPDKKQEYLGYLA
jgi:hypothetical protein